MFRRGLALGGGLGKGRGVTTPRPSMTRTSSSGVFLEAECGWNAILYVHVGLCGETVRTLAGERGGGGGGE